LEAPARLPSIVEPGNQASIHPFIHSLSLPSLSQIQTLEKCTNYTFINLTSPHLLFSTVHLRQLMANVLAD